ncbi:MAG: DUF2461 domain-containing protein, partial [Lutibacter sp.]|nr:DUF2461 domain-containing protein [Lutibacter sp.]
NNNRDWFQAHKTIFKEEQEKTLLLYQALQLLLKAHDKVDSPHMFRIYRDVRFSKNKTPYKNHFSGYFSRLTKRLRGSYYLHIEPGGSFLAGGFWNPNKEDLFRIRKEFEMDASIMRSILRHPDFISCFGCLEGSSLKTAPRDFDRHHPDIDLIRMKQFVVKRCFSDKELLQPGFLMEVDKSCQAMRPYLDYMSEVLTTDLNGASLIS